MSALDPPMDTNYFAGVSPLDDDVFRGKPQFGFLERVKTLSKLSDPLVPIVQMDVDLPTPGRLGRKMEASLMDTLIQGLAAKMICPAVPGPDETDVKPLRPGKTAYFRIGPEDSYLLFGTVEQAFVDAWNDVKLCILEVHLRLKCPEQNYEKCSFPLAIYFKDHPPGTSPALIIVQTEPTFIPEDAASKRGSWFGRRSGLVWFPPDPIT